MIKFENFISDTCREYFDNNPDKRPSKLVQFQYLINAYDNDVSNPPGLLELVDYLKDNVSKKDPYYNDIMKYTKNVVAAIDDFKKNNPTCIYTSELGSAAFRYYDDVQLYIDAYIKDHYNDLDHDDEFYDDINITKTKIYNKSIDINDYGCFDGNCKHDHTIYVDMNKNIVDIDHYKFPINIKDKDEYPELSKIHKFYLPYKQGDILKREKQSRNNCYYYNSVLVSMMMYDWNKMADSNPDYCEQVSIGEFTNNCGFDYSHIFCFFEYDIIDKDTLLKSARTEFQDNFFKNICLISDKLKQGDYSFNDAYVICNEETYNFIVNTGSII